MNSDRDWVLVTVTYNSAAKLRRFWDGVVVPKEVEWVVVDNGSSDDSVAVARSLGARAIVLGRNIGFGAANNVGFRSTESRYVGFINPDVCPALIDLETFARALDESNMTLLAPQLVNNDGTLQPNGRGVPHLWDLVRNRLNPKSVAGRYQLYAAGSGGTRVAWLTGAVVLGERTWLAHLGPWDEHFFLYHEDCDLGLRNSAAGGTSVVFGGIRWTHGWARDTAKFALGPWRLELSSMAKFYARYPHLLAPPDRLSTTKARGNP